MADPKLPTTQKQVTTVTSGKRIYVHQLTYFEVCDWCGLFVGDKVQHLAWHEGLNDAVERLAEVRADATAQERRRILDGLQRVRTEYGTERSWLAASEVRALIKGDDA